jgi:hypothetical protein
MWIVGYIVALITVAVLCAVLPMVGIPLMVIFVLWVYKSIFRSIFRSKRSAGEVLDMDPPPDDFHHHH